MATARCYSKSGGIEKYESNLWIDPTDRNWSSLDIVGTITTPDSRGNYTVTPATGFEDSNTQTGFYCHTMYGGVRKTFYFKESIKEIWLHAGIGALTNDELLVFLQFSNNEYLGNDKLTVNVKIAMNISSAWIDSVFFTVDKNSEPPLTTKIFLKPGPDKTYLAKVVSCRPMEGKNYKVTIDN